MALKDWKKIKNTKDEIIFAQEDWLYNGKYIEIDYFERSKKPYQLSINQKIRDHFKTKSQAIKYAKSYMRSH